MALMTSPSPAPHASNEQAINVSDTVSHSSDNSQRRPQQKSANQLDKSNHSSDSMAASQDASTHVLRQVTQSLSSAVGSLRSTMVSLIPQSMVQKSEMVAHSGDIVEFVLKVALCFGALLAILCSCRKAKSVFEGFNVREYCGIGDFLRATGYDKYDAFSLSLIVSKSVYLATSPVAVRISAGSNSVTTESAKLGGAAKSGIKQSLHIEVPQGTSSLLIEFIDPTKRGSKAVIGFKKIGIEHVLRFADEGEVQTITLKLTNKKVQVDPRVEITFCALNHGDSDEDGILKGVDERALSPEMQMLLQQQKAKEQEKNVKNEEEGDTEEEDKKSSSDKEQPHSLDLLAGTCTGKLSMTRSLGGQQTMYFAVYQCAKDGIPKRIPPTSKQFVFSWHFGWWKDQRSVGKEEPPAGKIPILRITNVQVSKDKENDFCIRYRNAEKAHENLFLSKASDSRSRAVWVESLHLFVEQCHKVAKGEE